MLEIRAAYVGLTELTPDFHEPREQLAVAFELAAPAAETEEGDRELRARVDAFIEVPSSADLLSPILLVLPLQLLAYHVAVRLGRDVDQPRNLAKSVTVE